MKTQKKVAIGFVVMACLLCIAGMFILPESLGLQMSISGKLNNYLPRNLVMPVFVVIAIMLGYNLFKTEKENLNRAYGYSAIYCLVLALTWIFNM